MTGTAFYVVAAIALCAALIKAPATLRRHPALGQRPIFVLLAVAVSCFAHPSVTADGRPRENLTQTSRS